MAKPQSKKRNPVVKKKIMKKKQQNRATRGKPSLFRELAYFNATHPSHLALPRRTGPYTVVRTTQTFTTAETFLMFGSFRTASNVSGGEWANVACVADSNAALGINVANNAFLTRFDQITPYSTSDLNGFEVCPAALTVRVYNGNALQTTSGVVYAGRSTTQMNVADSTRTWAALGTQFVNAMAPRPLSAAKLAIRGVQVSSYPLDMTDLSDFKPIDSTLTGLFTFSAINLTPVGLAPIVVYNTSGELLTLTYEVTMEWRVRFDMSDLACTTHTLHPPASQATWDRAIGAAVSLGHGVEDIGEVVGGGLATVGGLAGLLSLGAA